LKSIDKNLRVAVDVGGTFTDVVKLDSSNNTILFEKVPTTTKVPTEGVLESFNRIGADLPAIESFTHGTTLGLNSLLTRTGARVAFISTKGFRDIYLLGRTDRKTNYDFKFKKKSPLIERFDTFEVEERMLFDGSVKIPFNIESATKVAERIRDLKYESVAITFLHAYVNPEHEILMGKILREVAPTIEVTLSHEMSREYREYERSSTAVLDAYIKPIMRGYLERLQSELDLKGFAGKFLMTRSGGGAMTADLAREQPVNLILSGPAGGVLGAAEFSRITNNPNLITIDMGGTSLDASLIVNFEPVLYQGAEFEGLPINTPSLYIHTIGAGGGSIAWLDEAGALQVGPQSAGASPGPASYGSGGLSPTFTDAALVLGYLAEENSLGGSLYLRLDLAKQALNSIASKLNLSVGALAKGIVQISNTKIMGAVRAITVELGKDPKDFALLAFGGGGGLVAVEVARQLDIPSVIIPPGQGAFSALGMLMADVQHDFARTKIQPLIGLNEKEIEAVFQGMEVEAQQLLLSEGFPASQQRLQRMFDTRYQGQEHTVTLNFPNTQSLVEGISETFSFLHEQKYGHSMDAPIEITTLRLKAVGSVSKPPLPILQKRITGVCAPFASRQVYVSSTQNLDYACYKREDLLGGDAITGPAIIAEHTATSVIQEGDYLRVGEFGEMIINLKKGDE
jgi:N-methylhydantoinase A